MGIDRNENPAEAFILVKHHGVLVIVSTLKIDRQV